MLSFPDRATARKGADGAAAPPPDGKGSTRGRDLTLHLLIHPLHPPPLLHYWAAAETMAEDADLEESWRWTRWTGWSPPAGGHPSHGGAAVAWRQHDGPGWKEGLFSRRSLPSMEPLTLADRNITDPPLGKRKIAACGLDPDTWPTPDWSLLLHRLTLRMPE